MTEADQLEALRREIVALKGIVADLAITVQDAVNRPDEVLTVAMVADLLKVSKYTVYRRVDQNILKPLPRKGKASKLLFSRKAVLAAIPHH